MNGVTTQTYIALIDTNGKRTNIAAYNTNVGGANNQLTLHVREYDGTVIITNPQLMTPQIMTWAPVAPTSPPT